MTNTALFALIIFTLSIPCQLKSMPGKRDLVLYKRESRYAAFPTIIKDARDRLWVSFGWNTTGSHYGGAAGGESGGVSLYSPDGGETWYTQGRDEAFKGAPDELRSFTTADGSLIKVVPLMHEVFPAEMKEELTRRGVLVKRWPQGHISASYRVRMYKKKPDRPQWESTYIDLSPIAYLGAFGQGCILPDDTILKPVYGKRDASEPVSGTRVLRTDDQGETWSLVTVAYDGRHHFTEAELLYLPDGRVLALIRCDQGTKEVPPEELGFLWQAYSDDRGKTWNGLRMTDIWGHPPQLLMLKNGAVLCTYGYRRPPYGIRACFSYDSGETWDLEDEMVLRDDALPEGPGRSRGGIGGLGYPKTVELMDGTLFTVYYITLGDGVTHIAGTKWSRPAKSPNPTPH